MVGADCYQFMTVTNVKKKVNVLPLFTILISAYPRDSVIVLS